jgi:ribosomal protein S18 acetylase RimI-like enzyme
MIKQLDIKENSTASAIESLQKASYLMEAKLINFYEIPPLKDTVFTIKQSDEIFYGFYIEESFCGLISYKVQEDLIDIHRIAVHPSHFRKGIAKQLIKHVEKINPNIKKIIVSTGAKNEPAVKLYHGLGFKKIREVEIEKGLCIVKFEKSINL